MVPKITININIKIYTNLNILFCLQQFNFITCLTEIQFSRCCNMLNGKHKKKHPGKRQMIFVYVFGACQLAALENRFTNTFKFLIFIWFPDPQIWKNYRKSFLVKFTTVCIRTPAHSVDALRSLRKWTVNLFWWEKIIYSYANY